MSSRWSEHTTFLFVSEYIKHEALWNVGNPLYKKKDARTAAYASVEAFMNIPGLSENEIKKKIKNIRSTYAQELRKIKESKRSGAGTDTIYKPSVRWFQMLDDCLRNVHSECTETQSNLIPSTNPTSEEMEENAENHSQPESTTTTTTPNKNKRQRLTQLNNMVQELKGIAEAVNTPLQDENEFEVFGRSVGSQLKKMPTHIALEAQQEIQSFLTKIRLQHIRSGSITFSNFSVSENNSTPQHSANVTQHHTSQQSQSQSTDILTQAIYNTFSSNDNNNI